MIKNIEYQYLTEEERNRLEEYRKRIADDFNIIIHQPYASEKDSPAGGAIGFLTYDPEAGLHEADEETQAQFVKFHNEYLDLLAEYRDRYIKERKPAGLIEDIHTILDSITKSDFENYLKNKRDSYELLKKMSDGTKRFNEALADLYPGNLASPETCFSFVFDKISLQAGELRNDETIQGEIRDLVIKKVESLLSADPEEMYMIMARSKVTSEFSRMNSKHAKEDRIANTAIIKRHDVELTIKELDKLKGSLGVSTSKLFNYSLSVLTRQNDFRTADPKKLNREVVIPLREYAEALGYDVTEHITFTAEDEEKERKRVKNNIDIVRRSVKNDLNIIYNSSLEWSEKTKGKQRDFLNQRLVTRAGIKSGNITISFTPEIAEYLALNNKLTYYPKALLKLHPQQQQTAYYIGLKIAEHHAMDSNRLKGTSNILSVKTLLDASNLISFEELQKSTDRGHWEERIFIPFDNALETLVSEGVLKDRKYTHGKSVDLTEEEAYNINSYEKLASMYVTFEMAEEPDDTERLQKKQEARKKAIQKKKDRKKKETGK